MCILLIIVVTVENGSSVERPVRRLLYSRWEMIVWTRKMAVKREVGLNEGCVAFGAAGSKSGEIVKILQVSGLSGRVMVIMPFNETENMEGGNKKEVDGEDFSLFIISLR